MKPITVFVVALNQEDTACLDKRELKNTNATAGKLQKAGTIADDLGNEIQYSKENVYYLLHRRPDKGLLAGMWEFPNCAGEGEQGKAAVMDLLAGLGISITESMIKRKPVKQIRHVFSHKIWQMEVYLAETVPATVKYILSNRTLMRYNNDTSGNVSEDSDRAALPSDWRCVPASELAEYNLAGPHNKILQALLRDNI